MKILFAGSETGLLVMAGALTPSEFFLAQEWSAAGVVAVGAGSELCPGQWAKGGRFAEITQRAREFANAVAKAKAVQ